MWRAGSPATWSCTSTRTKRPSAIGRFPRSKRRGPWFSIRHCGWDRDYNVRLFRTRKGRYREQRVHSTIEVDGPIGRIDAVMYHDDKRNFEEYFAPFQGVRGGFAK